MKRLVGFLFCCSLLVLASPAALLPQGAEPVASLLKAHQAWRFAPASIEIVGLSTRGTVTEPIRITATQQEEVLIEYGEKKRVATPTAHFRDDGMKVTRESTPPGFTQLDATSVFFLSQLANMPIQTELPRFANLQGGRFQIVSVSTGRTEIHFSQYEVPDAFDLYINESGLLTAISRRFYAERPDSAFAFQTVFSDYRETDGVYLPFRIDRYVQNRLVETIAVSRYTADAPAPPTLFTPRRER